MSEEHHRHHHLFHHKDKDEERNEVVGYSETAYATNDGVSGYAVESTQVLADDPLPDYKKEEKHHKHMEHLGELGAAAAGAYAMVYDFYYYEV